MRDRQLLEIARGTVARHLDTTAKLGAALEAIRVHQTEAGAPRAQCYDAPVVSGARGVAWCWTHEREVDACRRHDLDCTGHPVTVSDPTGEAAIHQAKADSDRRQLQGLLVAINRHVTQLADLVDRWQPRAPIDPKAERKRARDAEDARRQVTADNDSCISCARTEVRPGVRRQEPYHRATTLGGRLDCVTRLCVWCLRFGNDTGRLPTLDELEAHHRGERVRRKA